MPPWQTSPRRLVSFRILAILLDCAAFGCNVLSAPGRTYLPEELNDTANRLGSPPKHVTSRIKEADMLRRQKTLACLHEELRTLALFDRVHDYTTYPNPADNRAYACRQIRRSQIMAEIRKLSPTEPEHRNHARIGSAVLLLSAIGYATLHYLLR
jgi:hypothetical protein